MGTVTGWLFNGDNMVYWGCFTASVTVVQTIELIGYLNRTNRQIAYFFDAVRNDDTTLRFPENSGNKALDDLSGGLNRVNETIKNLKIELREQEQFFKVIMERLSVGIVVYNKNGNIIISNSSAKELLEIATLTHVNQLKRVDNDIFVAFKESVPGDKSLVRLNGRKGVKQLSIISSIFIAAKEELKIIAIQDIRNELDANELDSWVKLIRVLTHEIMNTIAPITSLSSTILGYYKGSNGAVPNGEVVADTIKGLEVINERSGELTEFVDAYRKLTKIPHPNKTAVDVADLIESTIILCGQVNQNGKISVTHKVDIPGLEVIADRKQISQVLINLLKNSLESLACSENGKIILSAGRNENGRIQIKVIDNGPGIPDEIMDKIFVPFFSGKEGGSGIGLSLSRQIMLLHGGNLKISSVPGKYTEALLEF